MLLSIGKQHSLHVRVYIKKVFTTAVLRLACCDNDIAACSVLRINGERAFLRVNRLYMGKISRSLRVLAIGIYSGVSGGSSASANQLAAQARE